MDVLGRVHRSAAFRARKAAQRLVRGPVLAVFRRRAPQITPGVTVITVSWNTLDYLQVMVAAVQRQTPGVPILVIDNGSTDGTRRWAARQPGVRVLRLPANVHHGPAMDLGIHLCPTSHFVALDVDAFPISPDWINRPLADLASGQLVAGGLGDVGRGPFVHASYLAMSTALFVRERHTFNAGPTCDTAESITQRIGADRAAIYPPSSVRGPETVGTVFADLVYHNFYSSRVRAHGRHQIDDVRRGDPEAAWAEALNKYRPIS